MDTSALVIRLLDVIEHDIAARTRGGVAGGNKLFGAAILRKSDLSVVIAETNNETENPLWHGEMHAIKRFYELPADQRPRQGLPVPRHARALLALPVGHHLVGLRQFLLPVQLRGHPRQLRHPARHRHPQGGLCRARSWDRVRFRLIARSTTE